MSASKPSVRERHRSSVREAVIVSVQVPGMSDAEVESSIMRQLTGSEVLVEDKLFATLGTTVRPLSPPAISERRRGRPTEVRRRLVASP